MAKAAEATEAAEAAKDRAFWGGWKARALVEEMGWCSSSVVVGHSSGGTAALRVAERQPVACLIVVGAGYTPQDRLVDAQNRASAAAAGCEPDIDTVIAPWDFASLACNVGLLVVVAGDDDDVVPPAEAWGIASGVAAAAAAAAAEAGEGRAGAAGARCRVECVSVPGGGHFMDKESGELVAIVEGALRRLGVP